MTITPPFTISPIAQRLYDQLEPLAFSDPDLGYPLARFCEAWIGTLQEVDDFGREYDKDGKTKIGWTKLFDLTLIPDKAVPWLSQFVGVTEPRYADETDSTYAARLKPLILAKTGWRRATPSALTASVADTLTGTKTVFLTERQGSAYQMAVATWVTETPNSTLTATRARAHKPAGVLMTVTTITGGDFATLLAVHTDFLDVRTQFLDFTAIRSDPSLT